MHSDFFNSLLERKSPELVAKSLIANIFHRFLNVFSKKVESHFYGIAVYFMHYNFVRIHQTLRVTPAMAENVTQELWSMGDVVNMIEDWEAANSQVGKSN